MNKCDSEWRIWVQVIGVLHSVGAILAIIFCGIFFNNGMVLDISKNNGLSTRVRHLAIAISYFSVHLWASINLIKATELSRDVNDAYRRCQIYRITSIVLGIFWLVSCFLICCALEKSSVAYTTSYSLITAAFNISVYCFMRDLKVAAKINPIQCEMVLFKT